MSGPAIGAVCLDLSIGEPALAEVRRHLGYPSGERPRAHIARRIERVVAEASTAVRPRGAYAIHSVVGQKKRRLEIAGAAISGDVSRYLGRVRRVGVVVATAGDEVSVLAARFAHEGDALAAWIVDAVGSWAAEAAADAVTARLSAELEEGEALTLRYSPGYCGMAITQQRVLFGLVDAAGVGVTLMPSLLMHPLKSVSGIVGLGPHASAGAEGISTHSPCERCPLVGCHMRRRPTWHEPRPAAASMRTLASTITGTLPTGG
jgi:hypothetical protein